MVKISTSFRVEEKLLKGIKYLAFKNETTQTEILNRYISDGLKKDGVNIEELEV